GLTGFAKDGDDSVYRDGLALTHPDLAQDARGGRRNLGVDLVGRDLEQRLVAIDGIADLPNPANHRAFGDRLAHLGHDDGCGHGQVPLTCAAALRASRAPPRPPPPTSSDGHGWSG